MKRKEFYALGVMSGTSIDGLDFSLIKSDGKEKIKIIQNKYYKFNNKLKMKILNAVKKFKQLKKKNKKNEILKNLNEDFNKCLLEKLNLFFLSSKVNVDEIDIIGIHGNTVIHKPDRGFSMAFVLTMFSHKHFFLLLITFCCPPYFYYHTSYYRLQIFVLCLDNHQQMLNHPYTSQ